MLELYDPQWDNEPLEYSDDPLYLQAKEETNAVLANSDLNQEQYAEEWERLVEEIYQRLRNEEYIEYAALTGLTPAQQAEYWQWNGGKPPSDDDYWYGIAE